MAGGLDDPRTTLARREIVRRKRFLNRIYQEWYELIQSALPPGEGAVLELGSGAGFLEERIERLITSEILLVPGVAAILDACALPFRANSLRAVVMTDVLHHIPRVREFFVQAAAAVKSGGIIAMIEPWRTPWSEFVYRHFHHEPFHPDTDRWEFDSEGPLSSANGALPWILFERDRQRFARDFPAWQIERIQPFMPFRYLLSGGFSMPGLQPSFLFPFWRAVEKLPGLASCSMFALIVIRRMPVPNGSPRSTRE